MNYYSTYIICGWLNPLTTEPQIRRADSKVVRGFWTAQRVSILDPCAVEASVAFASPLNRWGKPQGFPGGSDDKKICLQCRRPGLDPWVGKSHVGYSPRGCKTLDTTERLSTDEYSEVLSCSETCPRSCCQTEVNTGFISREFDSNNS